MMKENLDRPKAMLSPTMIREQLRQFIVVNFLFGQDRHLGDQESLAGAGVVDSTGVLQLVSFLEETYQITVADEELIPENLDSISSITTYVCLKQNSIYAASESKNSREEQS